MLIASLATGLVALLAGITGTWSPCGLSSVQTLGSGLRDEAGSTRNAASTLSFTLASMLGGLLTFGAAGWLGSLLSWHGSPFLAGLAALLALVCGLADLRMLRIVPQVPRQVPEAIRWRLPLPVTGAFYGLLLGLGFTTYLLTYAMWALLGAVLLLGSAEVGIVVGIAFGLGRALPVVYLVGTYARPETQRFIEDMERRPLLLVGMRRLTGFALLLAAAACVPVAIASAQTTPIAAAWNPVVSGSALAYEQEGASIVVRADGSTVALPGRFATIAGANVAWWSEGVATIADVDTLTPRAQFALPVVTGLALSDGALLYRGTDVGQHEVLASVSFGPGGDGASTTLYSTAPNERISRPSASGTTAVIAVSSGRGSRILAIDLTTRAVRTLRTAAQSRLIGNPSVLGSQLAFTRTDRCSQALVSGPLDDASGDLVIAWFSGLAKRDPGWERHHVQKYNTASRCPKRPLQQAGGTLWSTAIGPTSVFVSLLAGPASAERTILELPATPS